MIRIFHRKAPASFAVFLAGLMVPVIGAGEELNWARLERKAPPELLQVAEPKRAALFFTARTIENGKLGDKAIPFVGFFISGDGLGLCPIETLCWEQAPVFSVEDEEHDGVRILKTPTVLGTFPEEGLALVKFAYKPKVALTISKKVTPLGTWVAFLSPSFFPRPTFGPILSLRGTTFQSKLKVQRKPIKNFSIAVPRIAAEGGGMLQGAPIVDAEGEVVAVYAAKIRLPIQTFTTASPAVGLSARIDEAVKKGITLKVPIPIKDSPFDPVVYSEEFIDCYAAQSRGNIPEARKCARALIAKFPESHFARTWNYGMGGASGLEPAMLDKFIEGYELSENAPPWERGIYHYCLGDALQAQGKIEEAILNFQKSDELYPGVMASAGLMTFFQRMGQLDKAEHYARRATTFEPHRIAYWDRLQKILYARGKYEEADKLTDRIFLLEDLY